MIPARAHLRAEGRHHEEPPRQHGQDAPRDGLDRHVHVPRRAVHGLVRRQPVRDVHRARRPAVRARTRSVYWGVIFCNCVAVQALWMKRWRVERRPRSSSSPCFVQLGMWSERFMLIVTSLHRDFLPVELAHVRAELDRLDDPRRRRSASSCSSSSSSCASCPFIPISELKEMRHARRCGGELVAAGCRWEAVMRSGVVAEFDDARGARAGVRALSRERATRASTRGRPYPVARSWSAPGPSRSCPGSCSARGSSAAASGTCSSGGATSRDFRIDVGGRPLNSAPAFIPITFESAVLAASLAGFLAMLWFCGLPRLAPPDLRGRRLRARVDRSLLARRGRRRPALRRAAVADELTRLGALRCERLGGRAMKSRCSSLLAAARPRSACRTEQTLVTPDPHLQRMLEQEKRLPYQRRPGPPRGHGDAAAARRDPAGRRADGRPARRRRRRARPVGGAHPARPRSRHAGRRAQALRDVLRPCHGELGDGTASVADKMRAPQAREPARGPRARLSARAECSRPSATATG